MIEQANNIAELWWRWMWPMFWQVSILIALISLADFALRKRAWPQLRYALWLLVLVKLVLPPGLALPTSMMSRLLGPLASSPLAEHTPVPGVVETAMPIAQGDPVMPLLITAPGELASAGEEEATPTETAAMDVAPTTTVELPAPGAKVHWHAYVMLGWLLGVLVLAGWIVATLRRLRRLHRGETASCDLPQWFEPLLADTARKLGLRRVPKVVFSQWVSSPAVFGVFRPVILMPAPDAKCLSRRETHHILLHELAHIRRGDLIIYGLNVVLQIVYWFNPLVWLGRRQLQHLRELCCDATVGRILRDKTADYKQTILETARRLLAKPIKPGMGLLGLFENANHLAARLNWLEKSPWKHRRLRIGVICGVIILVSACVLPMAGQQQARESGNTPGEQKVIEERPTSPAADTGADAAVDLQELIDAARPRSVVIVPKGIYRRPITINKPLTLRGESRTECILEVTADEPALLVKSKGPVTIDSLTIKWQLATSERRKGPAAAMVVRDTKAVVQGCRFMASGNFKRSPSAVMSVGFSELALKKCRFDGFEFTVGYSGGAEGSITDCIVINPGHCGISVYSGSKVNISRNIVTGSGYHGIRSTGGTIFVKDNLVISNKNRGIYLGNKSAKGRISNNVIMSNATGISAFARTNVRIENNLISNSSYAGLGTRDSCSISVRNNIFDRNTRGIIVFRKTGREQFSIGRNTFWANKNDTENLEKPGNSITADPLFEDPGIGDFSMRADALKTTRQGLSNPGVFKSLWKTWTKITTPPATQPTGKTKQHPEKQTSTITAEERKRIRNLINDLHRTKAGLILAEREQNSPDSQKKLAGYKEKLDKISKRKPQKHAVEALKKAEEIHGDKWDGIYQQLRSAAGFRMVVESFDTDMEPYARIMIMYPGGIQVISEEPRDELAKSTGINPYTAPDRFWKAYKHHLKTIAFYSWQSCKETIARFEIPDVVVKHILNETWKGWYTYGYQVLISLNRKETIQQMQKRLDGIERKLAKYPGWKKIEQEMFKSVKEPNGKTQPPPTTQPGEAGMTNLPGNIYTWQRTDKYVPANFEAFFPDDAEGGKKLDALFPTLTIDPRPDSDILSIVRNGLRRTTKHRTFVLRAIGNRYVWGKDPQNSKAVEIMYHAADPADKYGTRHYAVYFGLSVLKHKPPNVLRTLIDICMKGEDVGRTTWGCKPQLDELRGYLKPYLQSQDAEERQMAALLEKHFKGEIDFGKWKRDKMTTDAMVKYVGLEEPAPPLRRVKAPTEISYEDALRDLYDTLGRQYPCFELKKIDWNAVGKELLPRAKQVRTDEQFGLLCMELVARLEDSHASLREGKAKPPSPQLPNWDPGFACLIDDRGKPVVYYVDKGGPAAKAGVKIGMTVVSINGTPAEKAISKRMQLQSKYYGYSSERYLQYHAARFFTRQTTQGAKVRIVMKGLTGKTRSFTLPALLGSRYLPRLPVPIKGVRDSGNVSWKMLDDGIGYIYVRRIRKDLVESLDRAVGKIKGARGLIIDVRGNSGGGFDATRAHRNFALSDSEEPSRPRFKGPMALLIDSRCISAGEGWASWFIANGRARVFGESTAGASSRKHTFVLKNGLYKVTFPVKAYRGFLDRPIERLGLVPDVSIRQNARDLAVGRDTVLQAARQHLSIPKTLSSVLISWRMAAKKGKS